MHFVLAAAAPASGASSLIMNLAPLLLVFVVFYFLLIRPQQKRVKDHQAMIGALRKGDVVVTGGGMIGKIVKVADTEATVELADNVRVRVLRSSITEVRSKTDPAPANAANDEEN